MSSPKILSLEEIRRQKQKLIAKQYQDTDTRVADLERDLLQVIDMTLDLERRLDEQVKFTRKMLHLIQRSLPTG